MHKQLNLFLSTMFFLACVLLLSLQVQATAIDSLLSGDSKLSLSSEFLPVEQAFQVSSEIGSDGLIVHFKVTPEHYLYRHMFRFHPTNSKATTLGEPTLPKGVNKYDKFLQRELEIYPKDLKVMIPIQTKEQFPEITINFQGCAEAGLCYPPTTVNTIPLQASNNSQVSSPSPQEQVAPKVAEDSFLAVLLSDSNLTKILLLFYLGGLTLTFTPCVLPMIPIISAVVASARGSRSHTLLLTASYVLTMAATYALAGMLMGYFGASLNLQARLQSPWLLIPFALLFVVFALSLFGLFELQLPRKLRDKLAMADQKSSQSRKGTIVGAALAGLFSTLLVSPCISAPLAGALIYISSTGEMTTGGLSLLALGLGMGTPLFIVGVGGANLLPKVGQWMAGIKIGFGFLMLAVAVWMLERLIPQPATLMLWGALAIGAAVCLGALAFVRKSGWAIVRQICGLLLLVYGICLFVGGLQGRSDPLRPLGTIGARSNTTADGPTDGIGFTTLSSAKALDYALKEAANSGRPTFVDLYADWCLSCKVFEREVLTQAKVQQALVPFARIKLDITENSVDQRAILAQYKLFGPPAYLFFSKSGQELKMLHKQGEISADTLGLLLKRANDHQ